MLKALGLLLVFSCAVLGGFGRARWLAERAGTLAGWEEFLRQFSVSLAGTRAAPREIVRMLAKQKAFTALPGVAAMAEAMGRSGSFARAVEAALGGGGAQEAVLRSLGDVIGVRPLEEQLAALEGAVLLLGREAELAREESRRRGGLWQRMGVLLGLLAVVLLA